MRAALAGDSMTVTDHLHTGEPAMRATAVILGLIFSIAILLYAPPADAAPDALIGWLGIIAAVACWIHPRVGFVGFCFVIAVTLIASFQEVGHLIYTVMYAIPALFAWRSARRNRLAAERETRRDQMLEELARRQS